MDADKAVTATFTQDCYTLAVTIVGGGSVDKDPDLNCYAYDALVAMTPTADSGWTFTGWSGPDGGDVSGDDITMDADKTVTATFEECCTCPALDALDLKTNKSEHNINLSSAGNSFFSIKVPNDANHLWFKITRRCENNTTVEYNYYDGKTCGAYWESDKNIKPVYPNPLNDPPAWILITIASDDDWWPNNGSTSGISICQNGGNILKLKLTNTLSLKTKVYTIVINRGD
jgi:uncharacterized repeat protein (TIGR02543 family)